MSTKICKACKLEKDVEMFSKNSQLKDGRFNKCKACINVTRRVSRKHYDNLPTTKALKSTYQKEYWQQNKEKINVVKKRWQEVNPAWQKEYNVKMHAIRWANPEWRERQSKLKQALYIQDKEKILKRCSKYQKDFPEKNAAKTARRRATQLKAVPKFIDLELNTLAIAEAYDLSKRRTKLTRFKWHVDHKVPLRSKLVCGFHCYTNLQVIPAKENQMKSNTYWEGQW